MTAGVMMKAAREAGQLAERGEHRHTLDVPDRNLLTLAHGRKIRAAALGDDYEATGLQPRILR